MSGNVKKLLLEKLARNGIRSLSEKEIAALLMAYSGNREPEISAERLLEDYGSVKGLLNADINSLLRHKYLDERSAALIKLIPQLARCCGMRASSERLRSSSQAKDYFIRFFLGASEEQLAAAYMDEKLNVIKKAVIAKGSAAELKAAFRDIADQAFSCGARCVIISHNHPFGAATPSTSDYSSTEMLFGMLAGIGVSLIDHIVVGRDKAVSMQELPFALSFKTADLHKYKIN